MKEAILEVEATRFKVRLMASGFTQREGIDYNNVFSPVVKHSSIRMLLSLNQKRYGIETTSCKDGILAW